MNPVRIIESIRDGVPPSEDELRTFLAGYLEGSVEEYQMAAFLMAVVWRGLPGAALDVLVDVMLRSGEVLDLSDLSGPRVDKHSTGGIGDKVSIALAPLAAEAGLSVPMMAGRGLGHTGGTLDKLESIPGFRTDLSVQEFCAVVRREGVAIVGQTEEIAPLDRRLYALRSVTGTVASIPLIAASIMSKKLAEDLGGLVLDVKVGAGAFLPEETRALELARTMVGIGAARGVETTALLTAMDRPLGRTVGNALEIREAVACLRGEGPPDLRALVVELVAEMLVAGGIESEVAGGRGRARALLDGGAPLERLRRMVVAQSGDPGVLDDPTLLPSASVVREVRVPPAGAGVVRTVDPRRIGEGVIALGGGRTRLGQSIDHAVGFEVCLRPGQEASGGELIGRVHASNEAGASEGEEVLRRAVELGDPGEGAVTALPLVSYRVTASGVEERKGAHDA
jgi:thymidine phosphorylase